MKRSTSVNSAPNVSLESEGGAVEKKDKEEEEEVLRAAKMLSGQVWFVC